MDFKTNLNFLSWRTRFAMDRVVSLPVWCLNLSSITVKPMCPTWQLLFTLQLLNLAETRYFQLNTGNGLSIARAQPNTAAPASSGLPALGTHRAQSLAGCSFRNPPPWRHLPALPTVTLYHIPAIFQLIQQLRAVLKIETFNTFNK